MLVCRHWRAIILSSPGLRSQLTIRRATQKEAVQAFIQARKMRLGVTVDMNDEGDGNDFNAENFRACFTAAIQAASRWSSLNLISPPPHGQYKDLQILQPLTNLESLKLACGFSEFFEPLITAISRDAPPNLTAMDLADPAAVLYLVQPACSHIYHSLTTLKVQLLKRMDRPVDILPHLHRLETLEASRLCLPFYSPDSTLPLIHTLRFLYLKSVSVQWMAGRVIPTLETCRIIFPHDTDTIDASQPVTMPSCFFLLYTSNNLHPLARFHLPSLNTLDVKNAQWNVWRGNPQLASLCPIVATTPHCLTLLRLDVRCSGRFLVHLLNLAPVLEELWLGLAHPNALSKTFFQAFIVQEPNADGVTEMVGPPSQTIAPLCPSLKSLHLHYRRWTRGPDKMSLVVTLSDIVGSRKLETTSSFSLSLSFDEALEESHWTIGRPVRKHKYLEPTCLVLGIPTPHAIIHMSTLLPVRGLVSLPFKKAESLDLLARFSPPSFEFLSIRDHIKLMVYDDYRPPPPSSQPCALPLFSALRVLVVTCDDPAFLDGHIFHKLERCRLLRKNRFMVTRRERMLTEIGMPVCTRVDTDEPWWLVALKLPQIRELAVYYPYRNLDHIWEKHMAVNLNLSGLNLLHMKDWPDDRDLTTVLRSVPLLETLIISSWCVKSFRALLPMSTDEASGLKQTSVEGRTLSLLCPRLQSLQIGLENPSVLMPSWDMPKIKDVVTRRAECGSPLKVFTYSQFPSHGSENSKFEVIGIGGSFTMEKIVLPETASPFVLGI